MPFTFRKAIREATPLLVGCIGPSGGGKTLSGLRIATGIKAVRGGNIVGIDTEARRMLHYAGKYDFTYLEFGAPFSSERYCEALTAAAKEAAGGVVVVDSMSHEHEGPGGYLELHEAELDRMVPGNDYKRREKMTFTAWIKPAKERRRLINTLLQLDCAFVFCFRAKEKLKIVRGAEPIQLGWQAIAGEEFGFEMTARCLLPPGANGVPDWSEDAFRHGAAKRIADHATILRDGRQLDESIGEQLAQWAAGKAPDRPAAESAEAPIKNPAPDGEPEYISLDQLASLETRLADNGIPSAKLCAAAKVDKLEHILVTDYARASQWIDAAVQKRTQTA